MLIHRVAAYFGMDHNLDPTQLGVITGVTKATRIPEVITEISSFCQCNTIFNNFVLSRRSVSNP